MRILAVLGILALAGCGVDGAPVRPAMAVNVGPDGKVSMRSSVTAGPVTVSAG